MSRSIALLIVLVVAVFSATVVHAAASLEASLRFDENDRLAQNYLVYRLEGPECARLYEAAVSKGPPLEFREVVAASGAWAEDLFRGQQQDVACPAMCLDRGSSKALVGHVIPEKAFSKPLTGDNAKDITARQEWIVESCQRAEFGFINWMPVDLVIYWINAQGKRFKVGDLKQREVNTQWQTTTLGHKFEVVDEISDPQQERLVAKFVVQYDSFNVIGNAGSRDLDHHNVTREVEETLAMEWHRHNRVKRSFTEVGFNKWRMPNDLWNSMATYYYNNRNNKVREEWDSKGLYVNWWDVDAFMIGMPWGKKTYWQGRLKVLVEEWSGSKLELTDIYGMRRYEDGARLLTHVDREATHAASLIINVAQGGIREPWPVEIYDHANRLHEVIMEEGDIVYYESAKCLHGRMKPLRGEYYVNLFAHYRPVGDPQWFTRDNPEDTPEPLIDISPIQFDTSRVMPFLSDPVTTLDGPHSLMSHWRKVAPSDEEMDAVVKWHVDEAARLKKLRDSAAKLLDDSESPHSEL